MDLQAVFNTNNAINQFAAQYLAKRGWFASLDGIPRNNEGEVPWITYPAFIQLQRIVQPHFRVFEYGCGNSSIWWARHVERVFSVEHDAPWAAHVNASGVPNLSVATVEIDATPSAADSDLLAPFFEAGYDLPVSENREFDVEHGLECSRFIAYTAELARHPAGSFDVIVVDGMARVLTAWLAARYLKDDGFILFDDSSRWQYNTAFRFLREQGFYRLDYYGPGPCTTSEACTSIFTRSLEPFAVSVDTPQIDGDLGIW